MKQPRLHFRPESAISPDNPAYNEATRTELPYRVWVELMTSKDWQERTRRSALMNPPVAEQTLPRGRR